MIDLSNSNPKNGEQYLLRLYDVVGPRGLIPISRSSWYKGIREGRYPAPLRLGPRMVAWKASDIEALIAGLSDATEVKMRKSSKKKLFGRRSDNPKVSAVFQIRMLKRKAEETYKGYRQSLYAIIQEAAEAADRLKKDDTSWRDFVKSGLVDKQLSIKDRENADRLVLQAIFQCDNKTGSFYANAVQGLRRKGVPAKGIAHALAREGGLKSAASKGEKQRSVEASASEDDDSVASSDHIPKKKRESDTDETGLDVQGDTYWETTLCLDGEGKDLLRQKAGSEVLLYGRVDEVGKTGRITIYSVVPAD